MENRYFAYFSYSLDRQRPNSFHSSLVHFEQHKPQKQSVLQRNSNRSKHYPFISLVGRGKKEGMTGYFESCASRTKFFNENQTDFKTIALPTKKPLNLQQMIESQGNLFVF